MTTSIASRREICTVAADVLAMASEDHADLEAPTCSRHWRAAVGVVTWETRDDHERREPFCRECAWDVQSEALLARPFAPPVVSAVDLDIESSWERAIA